MVPGLCRPYCVRSWTLCNSLSWFGSVMVSSTNIKALWMNNLLLYNACIKIDWICIHLYHDLIVPALYFKIIYSHWHRAYMDLFNYYYRDCHEIFFCLLTHISLVPPTFLGHSSSPQARHNPCELMAFSTIALHIDCRWRLISLIDVPKKGTSSGRGGIRQKGRKKHHNWSNLLLFVMSGARTSSAIYWLQWKCWNGKPLI